MMEEEQRGAKGEGTNPLLLTFLTEEKQTQAKESRSPLEIKNVPQLTQSENCKKQFWQQPE